MRFVLEPMSFAEASRIAAWRYPPPYDFYDMAADATDLKAWLVDEGPEGRYSVFVAGELAGFFSFGADARVPDGDYSGDALDVGLGLSPDLAGNGYGERFVEAGLEVARRSFSPTTFRLSVAEFNERAIKVYERVGFKVTGAFLSKTKGGRYPFVLMERGV